MGGSKAGLTYNLSGIQQIEKGLTEEFTQKYAKRAMQRTSAAGEKLAKQQLTDQGSIRTGNLRNTTIAEKVKVNPAGTTVTGGIRSGAMTPQPDPGHEGKPVAPSASYASSVEARKPYMAPTRVKMEPIMRAELDAAHGAFKRSKNL